MEISLRVMPITKKSRTNGLDVAVSNNTSYVAGAQLGASNLAEDSRGAQLGAINLAEYSMYGAQLGAINGAGDSRGAQLGLMGNYANKLKGIQVSPWANICDGDSVGVQIALINIRRGNPWYSKFIPGIAIRTNRAGKSVEEKVAE